VKQSDLGEYEENEREKQKIQIYKIKHHLSLKPSHKDGKHQFPPQISKSRSIKEFGENISQLSLYVYVSYLNVSLLYIISQEVVSSLKVSHSLVEDWIFSYRDGTGVITRDGNALKAHSKVSHGVHNLKDLRAAATYSVSVVDWAIEDYFREDQQMREDPRK
jgi:hypothetical protein